MADVYDQSRTAEIYGSTIALLLLASVAVVLRIVCRKISAAPFWWDDWTIIGALVLYYGLTACYWVQTAAGGLGRHTVAVGGPVNEHTSVIFYKAFMGIQILYFSTSVTFKTSLILLYHRLFGVVRWFRSLLIFAQSIVACYFLVCLFVAIFECKPVAYYWDKSILGGSCINETQFYRWNGVANLLIDFMILSLTFPMVWRLKITLRQKITVSGIFALGTLAFVASVVRVTSFEQLRPEDESYTGVAPAIWTEAEQSLGIVCACLPCLRPLFGRMLFSSKQGTNSGAVDSRNIQLAKFSTRGSVIGRSEGEDGRSARFIRLPEEGVARQREAATSDDNMASPYESRAANQNMRFPN